MSDEPVRVLLVDDDPDYPVLIRDFLSDVPDTKYKVDWAATYKTAEEHIRRGNYDIYLVDYRLGEKTGLDLLRDALDHGKKGPVVILTAQATRELDLEAIQAGAVEFLIKGQFKAPDLERCIRYSMRRHRDSTAPEQTRTAALSRRMISFIGAKGGVGTTTVALNVAMCLARRGEKTLALDLRPHYGTLAMPIANVIRQDLGDLLRSSDLRPIDEAAVRRSIVGHLSGLEVLASPQLSHKFRAITPEAARAIIDTAYQMTSYMIIDMASDASLANREALWRSAFVGLVVGRDPGSVAAAERMLELLSGWGIRKAVGLVIVDHHPDDATTPVSEIAMKLNRGLYGVIPPAGEALRTANARNATLVQAVPQSDVARAFGALAERLAADVLRPIAV